VLILAVPGFFLMARNGDRWTYPLLAIWLANLYVIASWPEWSYGSGFGLRPYVDAMGLLAPPLAAVFRGVRGRVLQPATLLLSWLLVMSTVVQMIPLLAGSDSLDGDRPGGLLQDPLFHLKTL
jgi:hypothetical protein